MKGWTSSKHSAPPYGVSDFKKLHVWQKAHEGESHFLLTDSMMPEMGGADLVVRLIEMRPKVRVLMMSGYAEEIARTTFDASRYAFIEKPFTTVGLLNRVREVLNS